MIRLLLLAAILLGCRDNGVIPLKANGHTTYVFRDGMLCLEFPTYGGANGYSCDWSMLNKEKRELLLRAAEIQLREGGNG